MTIFNPETIQSLVEQGITYITIHGLNILLAIIIF